VIVNLLAGFAGIIVALVIDVFAMIAQHLNGAVQEFALAVAPLKFVQIYLLNVVAIL
jgi:hypothetical protein